jgi:cell division septal protein FtsQ
VGGRSLLGKAADGVAYGTKNRRKGNRSREGVLRAAVRTAERRRTRRRRAALAVAVLLGGPALAWGLAWGGGEAWRALFAENEFFAIRRIEVRTDGSLPVDHVLEYARVREGMNLFEVRPGAVRELLLTVPVVETVQVGRRLPDTLTIEVKERVAVARLEPEGLGFPLAVDARGHAMGPSSVRPSLPTILGVRDANLRPGSVVEDPMLPDALKVLELCNASSRRQELAVRTIDVGNEDYLDVGLATGEQVLLSRGRLAEKLDRLRAMRREARLRGLELAVYDLTVDRNYVGRPAGWTDAAQVAAE